MPRSPLRTSLFRSSVITGTSVAAHVPPTPLTSQRRADLSEQSARKKNKTRAALRLNCSDKGIGLICRRLAENVTEFFVRFLFLSSFSLIPVNKWDTGNNYVLCGCEGCSYYLIIFQIEQMKSVLGQLLEA